MKKTKKTKEKKAKAPAAGAPKRHKGVKIAALSVISIAAVLALILLAGAMTLGSTDKIYPNVSLEGMNLSGLTRDQAVETIRSAGLDSGKGNVLTVTLPGSASVTVTAADTGYHATAEEAADAAYAYGRSGNLLSNFFAFLRAQISPKDLADDLCGERDTASIRSKTDAAVAEANRAAEAGDFEIDEQAEELLIVKGASNSLIEAQAVYDFVIAQLDAHEQEAAYVQPADGDPTIDMQALHDSVCGEPINAHYDSETKQVVDGKPGIEFDVAEAQKLWDAAETGDTVRIPVELKAASFGAGDVDGLYTDLLSKKSTSLGGSSANRVNNITKAAERIDGVELEPGQSFSYNQTLGQRTIANGFKEAGAYANGQVVSEVGGGICQVSSTLYYCTLYANLEITSRTNHYFSVGYIEPGLDATVSWGSPDFVFVNSRTFPVKIHAYVADGQVTVEIWGTDVDGSYVEMERAGGGMNVTTYRCVYDKDGNLISREEEASSTYHSHDTAPKTTTAPSNPSVPSNPSTPSQPSTPTQPVTPATPAPVQTPTPVAPVDPGPGTGGGDNGGGGDSGIVL